MPRASGWAEAVDPVLTLEQVRAAAARFDGEMEQMPPAFSAKKIAGTPAYKLAREGKAVELKPATIRHSSALRLLALDGAEARVCDDASARADMCASVAHELGQDLGCGAHLSGLRRTQAGVFTLDEAHTLAELEAVSGECGGAGAVCHASAQPVAGDAGCDGRCDGAGKIAQRGAGAICRSFPTRRW